MDELSDIYGLVIKKAKSQNLKIAFITAGGATKLYKIFSIPGCSSVMQEGSMLYSEASILRYLANIKVHKFVSQDMADNLANRLYELSNADLCFSLTCALTTDRVRKGEDVGYICIKKNGIIAHQEKIQAIGNSRTEQDNNISDEVMHLISEKMDIMYETN